MSKLNFLEIEEIPNEIFYAMKWKNNTESFKVFKTLYEEACGLEREYNYYTETYEKVKIDEENISDEKQIIVEVLNELPKVYFPWKMGKFYPEKCMIVFSNKGFITVIEEKNFFNNYRYKK